MSVNISDLQPKPFKITIKGVELESKPLRLSHALTVSKLGDIFQDSTKATKQEIKQAEIDLDEVIADLVPELKDIQLDITSIMQLLEQLMANIEPADNAELKEKGVKFDSDPKAERIG
jgi:glutamyl-tRNA reductase